MKYFLTSEEKVNKICYEFYKGKWDRETFSQEDSIYLDDNILYEQEGFETVLITVLDNFDPFGKTEITHEQWDMIGKKIPSDDINSLELYYEASEWLEKVFIEYECFTIFNNFSKESFLRKMGYIVQKGVLTVRESQELL